MNDMKTLLRIVFYISLSVLSVFSLSACRSSASPAGESSHCVGKKSGDDCTSEFGEDDPLDTELDRRDRQPFFID